MKKPLSLLLILLTMTMSWTNAFAQFDAEYEAALASIEDGAAYYIKTNVSGTIYYLKTNGTLTATKSLAGIFKFRKTSGGAAYEYGYRIDSGGIRFSNPEIPYEEAFTLGSIHTTTGDRVDWDTQVLFLNDDGMYAIRATNSKGGGYEGDWSYVADTFWTDYEGPTVGYSLNFISFMWMLEKKYTADEVVQLEGAQEQMAQWIPLIQSGSGLVQDANRYTSNAKDPEEGSYAALLDGDYTTFFHSTWHASNDPQADHYLQAELTEPTQKFEFYYKRRSQNNNNRPTTIVISASNNGTNFTNIQTISSGLPTAESDIDYASDVIDLGAAYKYVRFTIPETNNGDKTGNHVFFTFSEFYMFPYRPSIVNALAMLKAKTPIYAVDLAQFKAVNAALGGNSITVTYKLVEADGTVVSIKAVVQTQYSEVSVPDEFTSIDYYDYGVTGTIGNSDCEIIVRRTFKQNLVLALNDLKNTKAYTITCDRGKFLTKDGYLASTAHKNLTNSAPSNFAIINHNGYYYLYSVADSKFVANTGALTDNPGIEDAIIMEAKTAPYFLYHFNKPNSYLNTNGVDPYGYVINDWDKPDEGNQYYMMAVADFNPTNALSALNQTANVIFDVYYNGEIVKTAIAAASIGDNIPAVPAELDNGLVYLSQPTGKVTKNNQHVQITATAKTPFEFTTASNLSDAKWYNITIRGDWFVYADIIEYPLYPIQDASILERVHYSIYHWAFGGNPYSVVVYNQNYRNGYTLLKINNDVCIARGIYAWDALANDDGFVLKVPGSKHNCVNQYNGGGGPLRVWDDARALTDEGCTFRIVAHIVDDVDSVPAASQREGAIYNVAGQRLSKMQKGINIVNGKKVLR